MLLDTERLLAISNSPNAPAEQRRIASAVCAAMNDWPTSELVRVEEFLGELLLEFAPLDYESIRSGASRLNMVADAWKAEGLTDLLAAWGTNNREKTLTELLNDLVNANQ